MKAYGVLEAKGTAVEIKRCAATDLIMAKTADLSRLCVGLRTKQGAAYQVPCLLSPVSTPQQERIHYHILEVVEPLGLWIPRLS